jgi:hypothetical protein
LRSILVEKQARQQYPDRGPVYKRRSRLRFRFAAAAASQAANDLRQIVDG